MDLKEVVRPWNKSVVPSLLLLVIKALPEMGGLPCG